LVPYGRRLPGPRSPDRPHGRPENHSPRRARKPTEREWLRERLFREARSAGALSHPNIVTINDSGVGEELAFIAMEDVDGATLQQRLAAPERMNPPRIA